ncbi:hypothetical protein GCM10023093_06260 [Nemorincola caseinilytica]|uniref:Tetratricopeptide repeat protein n=2 Tax=Nemorincola caseinilytica TaxID=2054315 RepID=A0ABP8N549_9BACT
MAVAALPGIAQDKYVVSANLALKSQNYDEAKSEIDKAMANPETAQKPKTLFAKAQVYFTLQNVDKYKNDAPYKQGLDAAVKLAESKPDYEKQAVDGMLLTGGFLSYNDGVRAYNEKKYTESAELMKTVIKVGEMSGGKRFQNANPTWQKQMDTVLADAYLTMANAAYFSEKYDEAIPLLIKVKGNPIRKSPSVYQCLIDAYGKQNNSAQELAAIEEGRKEYPSDITIRNYELNYYIKAGKMDELVKKLEEAAAKDPSNADLNFNLATTYLSMAAPKDGKKPANAADMYKKAEGAFLNALKASPDNGGYNYNFGALYFNQATDVNDQMNSITGSTKADIDKFDALKKQRDDLFGKATPYFEKAYAVLSPNEASLKGEDRRSYKSSMLALNRIYAIQNKLDKATEMKKKMDAFQ